VVQRPAGLNAFEFAVLAGLRAVQLSRGCTPRVNGSFKLTVIAQREVAERKVVQAPSARTTGEPRLVPGAPGPIGREFAPTSV
jgi:DNA-directed RNA polymerase subunit K/omega